MILNGILILLMGFTTSLHILLLLRIMQGLLGGVSTIGLILISSLSHGERLHKDISLFQNSITAGQLIGPPVGAYIASLFGYRAPFMFAFLIVSIFLFFCHHYVKDIPLQKKEIQSQAPFKKGLFFGWALCFMATIHVTFDQTIDGVPLKSFIFFLRLSEKVAEKVIFLRLLKNAQMQGPRIS